MLLNLMLHLVAPKLLQRKGLKQLFVTTSILNQDKQNQAHYKFCVIMNQQQKIGGETVFLSAAEVIGVFKIIKTNAEVWVKVETGGNDNNDFYILTILEIEAMKQEITSNDILTALNTDGHIALYINFETGKSEIRPESQKIIDQIVEMLKSNPTLKISVEGHTDNVGNLQSNQTLSENRAMAVMNAIASKGVDKSRLSSKGWGQTKPIDDNKTEDGKAKNRRVEIVKV